MSFRLCEESMPGVVVGLIVGLTNNMSRLGVTSAAPGSGRRRCGGAPGDEAPLHWGGGGQILEPNFLKQNAVNRPSLGKGHALVGRLVLHIIAVFEGRGNDIAD